MTIILKMTKREQELKSLMRNPCFYHTLRELIHEFLKSYKRLKIITKALVVPYSHSDRVKMELEYFYTQYLNIRAYQSLYRFCKVDRKFNKNRSKK